MRSLYTTFLYKLFIRYVNRIFYHLFPKDFAYTLHGITWPYKQKKVVTFLICIVVVGKMQNTSFNNSWITFSQLFFLFTLAIHHVY